MENGSLSFGNNLTGVGELGAGEKSKACIFDPAICGIVAIRTCPVAFTVTCDRDGFVI
jgi:hypothetical protein